MKISLWITVIVIIGVLTSFIPISQQRIISRGVDTFNTHRGVFAEHIFSQDLRAQGSITKVGVILVDLFRSGELVDAHISISTQDNNAVLTKAIIPSSEIRDDGFSMTSFEEPINPPTRNIRINIQAPDATSKNPLGVRYDPNKTSPEGVRMENYKESKGVFAVTVTEKVPVWRFILTNIQQHKTRWGRVGISTAIAMLLGVICSKIGWSHFPPKTQRAIQLGIIISVAALALNTRLWLIPQLGGVSGGDPYNYLYITESITQLNNPFEGVKRLPGYPLLLVPSFLNPAWDDQTTMHLISSISGVGALIMLYLLTQKLRLPWSVQFLSPVLIAWQKDFLWVSTRPEPYTFYTFLLLTSLVLFFSKRTLRNNILFGLILGYAAMTRQEGFVLAAILGIASVLISLQEIYRSHTNQDTPRSELIKTHVYRFASMYLPALLIVFPFFVHNTLEYGNPIFTPYFEGERLQIVDSVPAFWDSAQATWGVLGSMWKPSWDILERVDLFSTTMLVTFILTLAWWLFHFFGKPFSTNPKRVLVTIVSLLLIAASAWTAVTARPLFVAYIIQITASIMLISSIPFLVHTKAKGVLVWVVLVSQVLIATWFHPFAKHYQQSYPLIALMIVTTLAIAAPNALGLVSFKRISTIFPIAAISLPFIFITFILFNSINPAIDRYNANTALDSVVYRAVQKARSMEGPYGVDEAYLAARLYFGDAAAYFPAEENPTREQEDEWLAAFPIKTLIVTTNNNVLNEPRPEWKKIKEFKAEGRNERLFTSTIYELP